MKKFILIFILFHLFGCASSVKGTRHSNYTDALNAFEKNRDKLSLCHPLKTEKEFHSVIYQDNADIKNSHMIKSDKYPATKYLIGVEKYSASVGNKGSLYNTARQFFDKNIVCKDKNKSEVLELCKQYDSVTDDPKPALLTHIAKFSSDKTTFLYNVYDNKENCYTDQDNGASCLLTGLKSIGNFSDFQNDVLKTIEKENPTHIIVMSTGWNTYQSESIDNYNEWIHVIEQAAGDSLGKGFKPLYIGFSWESTWGFLYEMSFGFLSQPNKSNDADEVGLITANILVNQALKPIIHNKKIKLILIGHSFGARIMGHAAFSGELVPGNNADQPIDLFLGLQGAFSFKRFMLNDNDGNEGTPFRNALSKAKNVVLTNSSFDDAVKEARWTTYVGNSNIREKINKCCDNVFIQDELSEDGLLKNPDVLNSNHIVLVNADKVINMNKANTGGGAHSDVFNYKIGQFIWSLIK